MRTLPAGILATASDRRHTALHLLRIDGGVSSYYWTDAPYTIPYDDGDGEEDYVPVSFVVGDIVIDDSGNQTTELTFYDIDTVIRALLYNESWSYRPATLREVRLDAAIVNALLIDSGEITTDAVIDTFILADGRASGGSPNFEDPTEPVTLAIVPDTDAEGASGPSQEFKSSCRYVEAFKGIQCAYAGPETTCDGTFARCGVLGNQARYGGFRLAPAPGSTITVGVGKVTVGTR